MSLTRKLMGQIPLSEHSKGLKIFRAAANRFMHAGARYVPMFPLMRSTLHGLRGVRVGKNVFVGAEVFIDDADPGSVVLEDDVTIIARSAILGHAYYPRHLANILGEAGLRHGVTVKRGAYLGLQCVVLPGVTIGEYAIVGAGSVVTEDIPPYSVAMGAPARVVRTFRPEDILREELPGRR